MPLANATQFHNVEKRRRCKYSLSLRNRSFAHALGRAASLGLGTEPGSLPLYGCLRRLGGFYRRRRVLSHNGGMQDAITRDPEVMHGTPVFRGTRVPVQTLFDYIEKAIRWMNFWKVFRRSVASLPFRS